MPVELRVETEGKTEIKRVDVVGTASQYVVDPSAARVILLSIGQLGA